MQRRRRVSATRCPFRPSLRQALRDVATTQRQAAHQEGQAPVVASLGPRGIVDVAHEAAAGIAVAPELVMAAASTRRAITALRRSRPVVASRRARAVGVAGRDVLRS